LQLSIVIVNFNTGALLEDCLVSIETRLGETSPVFEYETIVVDNASNDGSEIAARKRKNALLISSKTNVGFGAGCNLGAAVAKGRFILFLNPDTRILSDNIAQLIERFDANKNEGALGCQNFLPNGAVQSTAYRFPNLITMLFFTFRMGELSNRAVVKTLLSPILKNIFGQFNPHSTRMSVDWVTGAFLLVKRDVWIKTGSFDERFFLFCEEIDLCKRIKSAGYDVVFDPSFEIEHYVGFSSKKVKPFVLKEKYKSYLAYFEKHHSTFDNVMLKLLFFFGIRFWIMIYRLIGDRDSLVAYNELKEGLDI